MLPKKAGLNTNTQTLKKRQVDLFLLLTLASDEKVNDFPVFFSFTLDFHMFRTQHYPSSKLGGVTVPEKGEQGTFLVFLWSRRALTSVLWRANDGNGSKVYDVTVAITTLKFLSHATRGT